MMKSYAYIEQAATSSIPVSASPDVAGALDSLAALIRTWSFRAQSRRELAELDDFLLADLGLDPIEAAREAAKPFWRA